MGRRDRIYRKAEPAMWSSADFRALSEGVSVSRMRAEARARLWRAVEAMGLGGLV